MRAAATLLLIALTLAVTASARAASTFFIRGGGDGHGIGMSQYGAYGYALHGKQYRFILAHYYKGTGLGRTNPRRVVRVLLGTGSASFSDATHAGGKKLNRDLEYTVHALGDGSLALVDQSGKQVGPFAPPLTVSGPGPLSVAGLGRYRGALQFRPAGSGTVQTVDAVGLDDYVRGVISAEMPAAWSPEALKVQAVAARTYAITSNVGGKAFDLYPDTRSQMYRGVAAETASTDAAVGATRGQIVTYRGYPAVTYFFNSSGGYTENIENVWPGAKPEPWLRGAPDPYDDAGGDPYHRWGYDISLASASAKLGGLVKGSLVGIRVTKHGVSRRILRAEVVGTKGKATVSGGQLQSTFGLLTTYAAFTTISTYPRRLPAADLGALRAVLVHVPVIRDLLSASTPGIRGSVFAAAKGAGFAIQLRTAHGWRTVSRAALGPGGTYAVRVGNPGTYRVVYRGLSGPAVHVS
jgi:stage II sporulation protein D